ncbi:uncharacterized mitochondrial protein AtMg00860-like [Solanum tuberosum]|uniref:uncharacterized mitochondrial protein AtMg00860-like n=1 Tax=Solanum tuberosum TaxID=4113 RepID=UPI00073A1E4F|nr:PREDICTED: uncharacterized mitochondrial protein AtMg00860-like [Solanum tuberosum]
MVDNSMKVFMDNFLVLGDTFEACLEHLGRVMQRYVKTKDVLNWKKCYFIVKEGIVLRHKILGNGIQVAQTKVEVIAKLAPPILVKGVRSFLGHAGFYRRFIKDFSKVAHLLCTLLEKESVFEFNEACVKAILCLKREAHFFSYHCCSKLENSI